MSETKKEKPIVRIRRSEFAGTEDKFYAPSDDIRNCFLPIVRGGLEAATARAPELLEELGVCAKALARYYQEAFLAEEPVPELVYKLEQDMEAANRTAATLCMTEIARAMFNYYGVAQRETSGHKDLTKPQMEKVAAVGALLSKLPPDDRAIITDVLVRNRFYADELDRLPQEGEIIERENEVRKNTEEA